MNRIILLIADTKILATTGLHATTRLGVFKIYSSLSVLNLI